MQQHDMQDDWRDKLQDILEDWKGNSIALVTIGILTYVFFFMGN